MARAERAAERLNIPGRRKRSTIPTIKMDRDAFGKLPRHLPDSWAPRGSCSE